MALSSTVVWEVRTDGADTNGGGFKTGASGTDWSQQAAAQYSVTDAVTNGTTTITSATANFGTDVVGNLLYITGGTGSIAAGWYEITARTNTTTITVDRSTGLTTGTGATLNIGGAMASPGLAGSLHTAGNTIWIKAGTYTISTATPGAGGPIHSTGSGVGITVLGYTTTRGGQKTTRPVLSCSVGSLSVVKLTSASYGANTNKTVDFLAVNADGESAVVAFELSSPYGGHAAAMRSTATGCATGFKITSETGFVIGCTASDCTTGFDHYGGGCVGCWASGGTTGFSTNCNVATQMVRCLATNCSGVGFALGTGYMGLLCSQSAAVNCGSHGFEKTNYEFATFSECVATGNGGYGFAIIAGAHMIACAAHGNTSGASQFTLIPESPTALPGAPWRAAPTDCRPALTAQEMRTLSIQLPGQAGVGILGPLYVEYAIPPRTRQVFSR